MGERVWLVSAALGLVAAGPAPGRPGGEQRRPFPDCGTRALFVLMTLEQGEADLAAIEAALGPERPGGFSMAELREAAGRLGLSLQGVQFRAGDPPLDRPAIAFFDGDGPGHHAVLRPVGTTGTMVQVIDPPYPSRIVDYARLYEDTPWTGRLLVPAAPWETGAARLVVPLVLGSFLCWVGSMVLRKAREARPGRSVEPVPGS